MPGSNSSFIPKRNPVKKSRKTVSRRVYTFTVVSYVFLFAILLAAAGVFVYGQYIERQLEKEIASLTAEIARFNADELAAVKAFDARLRLAGERVAHSVSIPTLFTAFEDATIGTVMFERLSLDRDGDDRYVTQAAIRTDSFDSSLFQRGVYGRDNVIADVTITELRKSTVARSDAPEQAPNTFFTTGEDTFVTFDALLQVAVSDIPYVPPLDTDTTLTAPAPLSTSTVPVDNNNQS